MSIQHENLSWQETALRVQKERDDSIARVEPSIPALPENLPSRVIDIPRQHLSVEELAITESSAQSLVQSLAVGKLTASSVVRAFLRRAAIAQKLVSF